MPGAIMKERGPFKTVSTLLASITKGRTCARRARVRTALFHDGEGENLTEFRTDRWRLDRYRVMA